jgi:hypothetical protein
MTELALHPPIHILGRRGIFVRSTDQAAAFLREHMLRQSDRSAAQVLRRLEKAATAADAERAAKAFRAWIAKGMHAGSSGVPARSPAHKAEHAGRSRASAPRRPRAPRPAPIGR